MHAAFLAWLLAVPSATQPVPSAMPPTGGSTNDQILAAAHLSGKGTELLDYFRKRVPPGPQPSAVADLVKQLTDPAENVRDRAAGALACFGSYAVPQLRQAVNAIEDTDRAARASACLQYVEGSTAAALSVQVARELGTNLPPGGAGVLLKYLPFAESPEVAQEIEAALSAYAASAKPIEEAMLAALKDESPVRRAAAASALLSQGTAHLAAVRPLLKDRSPTVRYRAAIGLVRSNDGEAVPVLISLLGELPPAQCRQAEEFLTELAGEWAVAGPKRNDVMARRLRREAWAAWWRTVDGSLLLDELRARTLGDDERERILAEITQLDSPMREVQEKATANLVAAGKRSASLLRREATSSGPRAGLARTCLSLIEPDAPAPLPTAALRVLGLRRPEGTLEVLLAYLPCAESDAVTAQVVDLLALVGFPGGKPDGRLVQALTDGAAERRAGAAVALCRGGPGGPGEHLPAVRRLLQDRDRDVRLHTALALARVQERSAIPVLVALLRDLPVDQAVEVEEFLATIAGNGAPEASVSEDPAGRAKACQAWEAWWRDHGTAIDLSRVAHGPRSAGHLLVVENYDPARRSGRVVEFDASGKIRWQIEGLQYPQYAEVLPGEHVLIAEQNSNLVTLRETNGKVIWQKPVPAPVRVQRQRNGSIFAVSRHQIVEFDAQGRETFLRRRPGETILTARRFPNGQVAFVTYQGNYVRLDAARKEIKTFHVPINPNFGSSGADITPDDHVILATLNIGRVAEFDSAGKAVWEVSVAAPAMPNRLPNGHILVVSHSNTRITELDRNGRIISERRDLPVRPWFVSKR